MAELSRLSIQLSKQILELLADRPQLLWSAMGEGYDVAVLIEAHYAPIREREKALVEVVQRVEYGLMLPEDGVQRAVRDALRQALADYKGGQE